MEDARDGFDQQRLGQAGSACDEAMASGQQRDQDLVNDLLLADDDFGQLGDDLSVARREALDGGAFGLVVG